MRIEYTGVLPCVIAPKQCLDWTSESEIGIHEDELSLTVVLACLCMVGR